MSLDFVIKDFIRKKHQNYQYLVIIILVISNSTFFAYFISSFGFADAVNTNNSMFFSGGIAIVYNNFNLYVMVLIQILSFVSIMMVLITFVSSKKKDIGIMRAVGMQDNYFYLVECYVMFFVGYIIGVILGLIIYGVFYITLLILGTSIKLAIDLFYSPILLIACLIGIYFIPGYFLRRLNTKNLVNSFSKDIPHNYNAAKRPFFIIRWLLRISFSFKIAVINTIRKRGEFRRYLIGFFVISLFLFSLGLGTIILHNSTTQWVNKAQGEHILVVGDENLLELYEKMYESFSNPDINDITLDFNYTAPELLINKSVMQELQNLDGITDLETRLVETIQVNELDGVVFVNGIYRSIGQQRSRLIPIIGIDLSSTIYDFEIEGQYFTEENSFDFIVIGDGLAYNFFDYPYSQRLLIPSLNKNFHISGVIIDTLYNGYTGYIDIGIMQEELEISQDLVNLIVIKYDLAELDHLIPNLEAIMEAKLRDNFTFKVLDPIFAKNINLINNITLYPFFLFSCVLILSALSIYSYLKGGVYEKVRDFAVMRAIGTKSNLIKKILLFESLFLILPSLLVSLIASMMLNSLFLIERASLPPVIIPFVLFIVIFIFYFTFIIIAISILTNKINKLKLSYQFSLF